MILRKIRILPAFTAAWAILACLSVTIASSANEFNQSAIRIANLEADPSGIDILEVSSNNGDIAVTGEDTQSVSIVAEIHVSGRRGEACEELANKVVVEAVHRGNRLIIDPELPRKIGYSISISYAIVMPSRLGANLETANGELTLEDAGGDSRLESTNGSIEAVDVKGNLSASSVNGSISLSRLVASRIMAETVNGNIECHCIVRAPEKIDISTVNGGIEVTLPKGANAALSADTVNGGLFISTGQGQITSKNRGSIEMSIGAGEGRYEMSSVNGSINVVVANPPD